MRGKKTLRDYIAGIPKGIKTAIAAGALFGLVSATPLPAQNKVYEFGFTPYISSPHTELGVQLDKKFEIPPEIPNEIFSGWSISEKPSIGLEFNQTLFGFLGLDVGGVYEPFKAYMGNKDLLSLDVNTHRAYANLRLQHKFGSVTPFISGGVNYSFWDVRANVGDKTLQLLKDSGLIPPEEIPDSVNPYVVMTPGLGWQAFAGVKAQMTKHMSLMARVGYLSMTSGPIEKLVLEMNGEVVGEQNLKEQDIDLRLNRQGPVAELGVSFEF